MTGAVLAFTVECTLIQCQLLWWKYWYLKYSTGLTHINLRHTSGPLPQMWTYYTSSHAPGETTSAILNIATGVSHTTTWLAPPYITNLLEQRATRVLCSTTNNDFYVPPYCSWYCDRMFSVAGPRLWNSLPAEMKKTCCLVMFKRLLKTHLFRAVYEV